MDYSTIDQPVSDLFPRYSEEEFERYRLSDDQLNFFETNGYVSGIQILDSTQLAQLRNELAEFFEPEHDGRELWHEYHANESGDPDNVLFHALGAWRLRAGFHDLLWHPAYLVPASQLLKGSVRFWHDQLFSKPAKHGGVVAWHQDYSYWTRTQPMSHLTCWIGLDDSTVENGCLQYIQGSHEWDLLPITGLAGDMDAIKDVLTQEQYAKFRDPVAVELLAGQASFHHPLLVHGSRENRSYSPRRATVINVLRDGVESRSNEPLLEGVPTIPSGEPVTGRYFPLLFDKSRNV